MKNFKRDIYRLSEEDITTTTTTIPPTTTTTTTTTTPAQCFEYLLSTNTNAGAGYVDCEGILQSISIGGTSGYDFINFCALENSVVTSGDATLNTVGVCPAETTTTTTTTSTTTTTTQPPAQYYGFQAVHPEAQGGTDYVRYIDEFGVEQTFTLIRDDINGNPCEAIYAQSIIQTLGAIPCAV